MTIRSATPEDVDLLMSLVERLESELPPNPYDEDPAEVERAKVERMVSDGVALIAEDDGTARRLRARALRRPRPDDGVRLRPLGRRRRAAAAASVASCCAAWAAPRPNAA